jgi:hypothetical protein
MGYQYAYDRRTDRQGQSIYLRWTNKQNRAINIPTMAEDRQGQFIVSVGILIVIVCLFVHCRYIDCPCLSSSIVGILIILVCLLFQRRYDGWRQKKAINIPTMDEQTAKGNQYTYDGWRHTRAINIPTMDEQADKGNQYTYDGRIGMLIALVCLFVHRKCRYIDCYCLSVRPS